MGLCYQVAGPIQAYAVLNGFNRSSFTWNAFYTAAGSALSLATAAADKEIVWRQDAVDAGVATEEETVALTEWKKYPVQLMRVNPERPGWPPLPGAGAS